MRHSSRINNRAAAKGFTVLELIVALTLGLVLLSAVWTMFRLFLRHQEIETAQVEKVQLVSSLHQHLSQELLNLFPGGKPGPSAPASTPPKTNIPLPPSPGLPFLLPDQLGGMGAEISLAEQTVEQTPTLDLSASSLVGNSDRLELTVFASADDSDLEPPSGKASPSASLIDQDKPPRSPTKKITYEFVAPKDEFAPRDEFLLEENLTSDQEEIDSQETRVGLWRRELVASTGSMEQTGSVRSPAPPETNGGFSNNQSLSRGISRRDQMESLDLQNNSQIEEFAPEIIDLQFDYFDGRKWLSSWDSQKRNRLPVLVRVRFAIETRERLREQKLEERAEKAFAKNSTTAVDDESAVDSAQDSKRIGPAESLDPNWDYQFVLFVSPPTKPAAGSGTAASANRGKIPERATGRANNLGGGSK